MRTKTEQEAVRRLPPPADDRLRQGMGIAHIAPMQPYEIVRKDIAKVGPDWQIAPDQRPAEMRIWSGFLAFVPGDAAEIRKRVDAVKISYRAEIISEKAGAWVMAGYNDLEKIIRALRQPA